MLHDVGIHAAEIGVVGHHTHELRIHAGGKSNGDHQHAQLHDGLHHVGIGVRRTGEEAAENAQGVPVESERHRRQDCQRSADEKPQQHGPVVDVPGDLERPDNSFHSLFLLCFLHLTSSD